VGVLGSRGLVPPARARREAAPGAIEKKHGKGKALSILAHKIGRAVYYMLSRGTVFSLEKFRPA
jgi:hypothetical protein